VWVVGREALRGKGKTHPLLGQSGQALTREKSRNKVTNKPIIEIR